jgi:hypothetical protein
MDAELARDRAKIEQLNPQLPEGAKKALTSLLYNLGGDVNKLKEHGMAEAIAGGDVEAMKKAHVEFSHIHVPQGEVEPGLLDRRIDELAFYNEADLGINQNSIFPLAENSSTEDKIPNARPLEAGQRYLNRQPPTASTAATVTRNARPLAPIDRHIAARKSNAHWRAFWTRVGAIPRYAPALPSHFPSDNLWEAQIP